VIGMEVFHKKTPLGEKEGELRSKTNGELLDQGKREQHESRPREKTQGNNENLRSLISL